MNTLNKKITAKFFNDPEGYSELCNAWKDHVNNKEELENSPLDASCHLLYLILRGKDWRRGFAGVDPDNFKGIKGHLWSAGYHPVFSMVRPNLIEIVKSIILDPDSETAYSVENLKKYEFIEEEVVVNA